MLTGFTKRGLAAILLFVAAGTYVAVRFAGDSPVDTDIVSLLPGSGEDPVVAAAIERANSAAGARVALLIEGGTATERQNAATQLSDSLVTAGVFQPSLDEARPIGAWVFAHRDRLLCPADRARLQQGDGAGLAREILAQWYSPFSASNANLLESDPLLLTPRFVICLAAQAFQMAPLPDAVLISGSLTGSAYRIDVQDAVTAAVAAWQEAWKPQGLQLARAGAVFHASYGAAAARGEMSVIGGITLAVIILLYAMIFRSLRPPLLAALLIGGCLATGVAVTLLLFGQVHVMVMVFAAALIGMVVDYTTYFLLTGLGHPELDAGTRARSIARPLTVGMATTVGAFAALLAAPIDAFRQIAVCGGVGLVAAWYATLYLLPSLEGRPRGAGLLALWLQRLVDRMLAWSTARAVAGFALALALIVGVAAWFAGEPLDDVRRFQSPSPQLAVEEQRIRELTGFAPVPTFFLVRGTSRDAATANEERLLDALTEAGVQTPLASSRIDPSAARAGSDRVLLREALITPHLAGLQQALGLAPGDPYAALNPAADELPALAALLRGETGATFWSIVPLSGDLTPVAAVAAQGGEAWALVDAAEHYSQLLAGYRGIATLGLVGSAVIIGLVLMVIYRRLAALWIMLPTVLALILTPAITTLLGLPYSFFSAMGLLLVIGAGVDYGIFQWERPAEQGRWTRLGIALAATMTCVSVGLLGLSSVLPVMSFGITVALGIVLSLLLSPLVRCGVREGNVHA